MAGIAQVFPQAADECVIRTGECDAPVSPRAEVWVLAATILGSTPGLARFGLRSAARALCIRVEHSGILPPCEQGWSVGYGLLNGERRTENREF